MFLLWLDVLVKQMNAAEIVFRTICGDVCWIKTPYLVFYGEQFATKNAPENKSGTQETLCARL